MKVTKKLTKQFESEQQEYGTAVAIHNLLWLAASNQLHELGAKTISVSYRKRKRS